MSTLLGWLKSAAASVRESPMDAALTAAMVLPEEEAAPRPVLHSTDEAQSAS